MMARFARYLLALTLGSTALPTRAQTPAVPVAPTQAVELAATLPPLTHLTPRQVENVTALGQVWGFLKYFHPAVAAGQRDWDAELLRQLPAVLACRSPAARSRLLSAWITRLGPVPPCSSCAAAPLRPVHQPADLRWARDPKRFSAALRQQLAFIEANRYQGPYYYVTQKGSTTYFPHEQAYAEPALPAPGLRLLGLIRYWNMFQYYFPYRYALDEEWSQVLPDLLPRFAQASTPLAYRHAALALFARVHDGHARFYPPDPLLEAERGAYQVAADVQFLEGEQAVVVRVRPDALVPPSPLEPGDVLTHWAGTPVADLVRQRLPETGGANRAAQLHTIALNLPYAATPTVAVQVVRAGRPLSLVVPARRVGPPPPASPADSAYCLLTPEIGYIDMLRIRWEQVNPVMQAFAHTKGLVLDQRNYPNEVAMVLPRLLLTQPVAYARFAERDSTYPGRFLQSVPDTLQPLRGVAPYTGRVVVLVNEVSRSRSEFTAMSFQATPHGTVLGSQTAGSDGNTTPITLPGGLKTLMTGLGVYYPDGGETQRVGIRIDVPVRPTIAGIRAGRDELVERAVELINEPAHRPK